MSHTPPWLTGPLAALLVSTALVAPAHAATPPVFSPAWFAVRTAGRAAAGTASAVAARSGASLTQVAQSIANLQRAAQAIAAAGAAQAAARAAAFALPATVPDGLTVGGLQPAAGATPGSTLWQGANLPTQSGAAQRPTVTVRQTSRQAVLTWQTFNVGRNTTLAFDQSAGGAAANTWVALNRVSDPNASPSQILGSITAPGQVYVINRNGVIFGATSQVNTGALIASAADISTSGFLATGIYSPDVNTPIFTGAAGAVTVQAGAQIATSAPASANSGGGFVLLLGSRVDNAGAISTPQGQTALAAGRDFVLRAGYGSSSNADPYATVQGDEVAVTAGAGSVGNTGLITATDGDVTLVGHAVTQAGVIAASTGLGQRGTVHLLTDLADSTASVTLAPGSVTAITIDSSTDTALEALRSNTPVDNSAATVDVNEVNNYGSLPDIRDLSRIEISSGDSVLFGANSLALASSGQIAVAARGTVLLQPGAEADVSGLVGVSVPQAANVFQVSIEPYNLRDSPDNRATGLLDSQSVSVDARTLLYVPPENGDSSAREYTGGGLIEVSGELGNVGHTIAEYSTTGGTVQFQSPTVVTQPGSTIDIAGGSIQYQAGLVPQTWLLGADGRIYNLDNATDAVTYTGVFNGFSETHPHWGVTQTFINLLIAPSSIEEAGYTVGHDVGSLTISAATSKAPQTTLFAGAIAAGTVVGAGQDKLPTSGETGLLLTQNVVPQGGTLTLADLTSGGSVLIGGTAPDTLDLTVKSKLTRRQSDTVEIAASALDSAGLGSILVESNSTIAITGSLSVADGGSIDLLAPVVTVTAPLVARGGSISLGETQAGTADVAAKLQHIGVTIAGAATIDTRGVWTNALQQPDAISTEAWVNGGAVTVESSGSIALAAGSAIDASAGGYIASNGSLTGGAGGNIALIADAAFGSTPSLTPGPSKTAALTLDGSVRSIGYTHGGALTLQAPGVAIGDGLTPDYAGELVLSPSLFASGFSNYTIIGATDVSVAPGAQVNVVEPVYQGTTLSAYVPGGSDPDQAFQVVLPPLYLPNPLQAKLTQRVGASLTLDAPGETTQTIFAGVIGGEGNGASINIPIHQWGQVDLGAGATVAVDPKQSVILDATLSAAIDGSITAPGGTIEVLDTDTVNSSGANQALGNASVLVGPGVRLDVAGTTATALDNAGRSYGVVLAGGTIVLGNTAGQSGNGQQNATDAFVVVDRGAVLDASGASAAIDLGAGLSQAVATRAVDDATGGGLIHLASYSGIVLDGTLRANAGGASAAGGTLEVVLETGLYSASTPTPAPEDPYLLPRTIVVTQSAPASAKDPSGSALLQSGLGTAELSANAIEAGGFGTVSLFARDAIEFKGDVTLSVAQAITLDGGALSDASARGKVTVSAPYVLLSGVSPLNTASGEPPYLDYPVAQRSAAVLTVDADLIDLQNAVIIGATSEAQIDYSDKSSPPPLVEPGFGKLDLVSSGDIRFLVGSSPLSYRSPNGRAKSPQSLLVSYGDVSFSAAQVYPVTGATAEVSVGLLAYTPLGIGDGVYPDNPRATLTFTHPSGGDPGPPLSVFGFLSVNAPTIDQGGVLRAPFGVIEVGGPVSTSFFTSAVLSSVTFLPGSITSVSMAGQSIPYGGSADGITYNYGGAAYPFSFGTNSGNSQGSQLAYGISVAGQAIAVDSGATLDLQGGGTITGAAFLPGRGGSTDTLLTPLVSVSNHAISAPTLSSTDSVYALLPGVASQYAPPAQPDASGGNGSLPGIGQTVTIGTGVPGLPAGTYTVLPSYYALQPGGYRIELRTGTAAPLTGPQPLPNGSVGAAVQLGIANTAVLGAIPVDAIITPGATLRSYSQYDEQSYAAFATSQPSVAVFGFPRPLLPEDAGELDLVFGANLTRQAAFVNDGTEVLTPAAGGLGGTLAVYPADKSDALVIGDAHTKAADAIVVDAAALDAVNPASMVIGGFEAVQNTTGATIEPQSIEVFALSQGVTMASGASLTAPQVLFASNGTLTFDARSTVDTIGRSGAFLDSSSGLAVSLDANSFVAVTNGSLDLAASNGAARSGNGIVVAGGATLYTAGTLAFATDAAFTLSPLAQLGASGLFAVSTDINIADAGESLRGIAPSGLLLSEQLLDTLLAGNAAAGVPALQTLDLTASQSLNFYGSTQLNGSGLKLFVLNTPGIYGYGTADDDAVLNVGTLYWNGDDTQVTTSGTTTVTVLSPPLVSAGGPGTGLGTLDIQAQEIVFGYGPNDVPQSISVEPRAIFGFGTVDIAATQQIVAANRGSLLVYQAQGTLQPNGTLTGTGGALNIATPLLTAAANGTLDIAVGGAVTLSPGLGVLPSTVTPNASGGEIGIAAASIDDATAIVLPSGRALLTAQSDITLESGARLDVSGESRTIVDQTVSGPGGIAALSSAAGGIAALPGSTIAFGGAGDQAGGTLSVSAAAGTVALDGSLQGGGVDAADSGAFTLDAGALPSFAALSQALTAGGVFGARSFEVGSGDLTIETSDQLRAHTISVSVDGGSLTVDGLIDASGASVGTIALAGQTGMALTGNAVLAAQGSVLAADSYGQPIDAENRAEVSLTSAAGTLALAPGATIALDSADSVARGDLELNAPRGATLGTVAVSAPGSLSITGAATIALNGFASYHPTDGVVVQTNTNSGTVLDAGAIGLDQIQADNTAFETAALANSALDAATAGLSAYGSAYHVRPGVIIDSSATTTGNLSVDGDLDLSALRYGKAADGTGAGEPGVLVLRAAGNLGVYGSVSDGFQPAPATPDDAGWLVKPVVGLTTTVLTGGTLEPGTTFSNIDVALGYPVTLASGSGVNAGMAVPVAVTLAAAVQVTQPWTATAPITLPDGGTIAAGQTIPSGTVLRKGTVLAAGSTLPDDFAVKAVTWPAGASFAVFSGSVTLGKAAVLVAGDVIPGSARLVLPPHTKYLDSRAPGAGGVQGSVDALAAMLPAGDLSWSIGLVAGANLAAANPYAVLPAGPLAAAGSGNLLLDDPHYGGPASTGRPGPEGFSVVRTGTGALTLAAGGSIDQQSPFGIYTAGTQSADVAAGDEPTAISAKNLAGNAAYQAVVTEQLAQGYQPYYPTDGGNLSLGAQGSISLVDGTAEPSGATKGWLWEQGSTAQPASWWINFGTYAGSAKGGGSADPAIAGFQGIGTLGGGDVAVQAGGDIGETSDPTVAGSNGITLAVGATGRVTSVQTSGGVVTGGALVETGGGSLEVRIGGALLADTSSNATVDSTSITDIRGTAVITAGSVGLLHPIYDVTTGDPRFIDDPNVAEAASIEAGVTLTIGDGTASISTRGDLVLTDALDPGRQGNNVLPGGGGTVGFSLWQPGSTISLASAGGNISPNSDGAVATADNVASGDTLDEYPPGLLVAAQHGDIYFDGALASSLPSPLPIELAPSGSGDLSLLAAGSIYGTAVQTDIAGTEVQTLIQMSGAPDGPNDLPNPFRAAHGTDLFPFETDSPVAPLQPEGASPIHVYAGSGDIVGLTVGQITVTSTESISYQGSLPTRVVAGDDIVDFGQIPGKTSLDSAGLFVNDYASDVSVLQAGRDIIYASTDVAGPGLLYVQAGRDLYQANQGVITSLGQQVVNASIPPSDSAGGAAITALVGVGSTGPAWAAFADLYFNDANQANLALPLADPANAGKVQQTYGAALLAWLQQNTGYTGDQPGALAAFLALPVERQSEFLLPVYFDELRLSGRQFTDPTSLFYKSYVRGKQAIATLFPGDDYQGGVTMFALPATTAEPATASAITTNFGGDITVLAPGSGVSLGSNQPGTFPSTYGLITFGQGDVDVYSLGSVLLGTSRIFTTFGGGITIWSAEGDINAGAGTKSAVVAQPFSLNYDLLGDITLSPQAPSTGAGIATLNEIPGTQPGDVDLVAPQGTIDAGEAGIRSSGNANLAALAIANGANLQVQGKTTGTPVVQAPNIGALTAAASVGGAAQNAGQQTAAGQQQNTGSGSIITVEVLGFGG